MKQQTLWTRALTSARTQSIRAWTFFKYEFIELNWYRWYALKSYVLSALWIVPFVAVLVEMVLVRLSDAVSDWLIASGRIDQASVLAVTGTAGVRSMLETIIAASMSFLVFTFGSLLVAIQVAGGQYTPRVIATIFLRDNVVRSCVGLFVVTLLFANRTLRMMGDNGASIERLSVYMFGATQHCDFPVSDRLRGENAASGQHCGARRGVGTRRHQERLSGKNNFSAGPAPSSIAT